MTAGGADSPLPEFLGLEGDATAMYIKQQLDKLGVKVTRLARGLPVGGDLEYADEAGIRDLARSGTVAVSLPLASLYLREPYLPARRLLDAGVPVAVATDFNPGSAPSYHLPLALSLACLNQGMTPQEALMGCTAVAARAVARADRIGSLASGLQADIAVIGTQTLRLVDTKGVAAVGDFIRGLR